MRRPWVIAACPPVRERRRRCWYAAPFRRFARLVSIIGSISICMVLSRCVGRSWPSLYIDLANPATLSDPTHSLGMVNLCDDASLAISLPESTLVQSPPQMSACAHMHIHIRILASSDARLAAARGSGRYSRWTRYQHGCGTFCRASATRRVGSDSDFQVWGKLG